MERTKKSLFMVKEQGESIWNGKTPKTHLWFEALETEDAGIRVSVPLYDGSYSAQMEEKLATIAHNDVVKAVLERESPDDTWKPIELELDT